MRYLHKYWRASNTPALETKSPGKPDIEVAGGEFDLRVRGLATWLKFGDNR